MTGMSLGGMTAMHEQGGMMPGFARNASYWYKYGREMSPEEFEFLLQIKSRKKY